MQVKTTPSIAHAERNYESPQYMLPSDDIEHERYIYIQILFLSYLNDPFRLFQIKSSAPRHSQSVW